MNWYENRILSKLFLTTSEWNSAWKDKNSSVFNIIDNPKGYWLADSLLFQNFEDNKYYLFVEAFDKKERIGKIAVLEYSNGKFENFRIVISEKYHLSYPYVFKYKNKFYMIPESSENGTVDLYVAEQFPGKWKKQSIVLSGAFVDTTLFKTEDGEFIIYTYSEKERKLFLYKWNLENNRLTIIKEKEDSANILRDGGNIFIYDSKLIRAVQFNSSLYGRYIRFVTCPDDIEIKSLRPENILTDDKKMYRRIHTYSVAGDLEAIDLSNFRFDVLKTFRKINDKFSKKR